MLRVLFAEMCGPLANSRALCLEGFSCRQVLAGVWCNVLLLWHEACACYKCCPRLLSPCCHVRKADSLLPRTPYVYWVEIRVFLFWWGSVARFPSLDLSSVILNHFDHYPFLLPLCMSLSGVKPPPVHVESVPSNGCFVNFFRKWVWGCAQHNCSSYPCDTMCLQSSSTNTHLLHPRHSFYHPPVAFLLFIQLYWRGFILLPKCTSTCA